MELWSGIWSPSGKNRFANYLAATLGNTGAAAEAAAGTPILVFGADLLLHHHFCNGVPHKQASAGRHQVWQQPHHEGRKGSPLGDNDRQTISGTTHCYILPCKPPWNVATRKAAEETLPWITETLNPILGPSRCIPADNGFPRPIRL